MPDQLYPGASESEGRAIRILVGLAMDAPTKAKSGHSGTAMALAPLGVTLFNRIMRHNPDDPSWPDRDRFVLSCGHVSILQYGLAHVFGYDVTAEDLRSFRQPHSKTPGHPEVGMTPTVEVTTGPLGQGFANGVGLTLAERLLRNHFGPDTVNHHTWVIAGDGCLEEGISHEAASLAGRLGLGHLTVFYDDNHITIDGDARLANWDNTAERFRAYGWDVVELGENSNNLDVLERAARDSLKDDSRPTIVIVRSHIAFPSPTWQDRHEAHGAPFNQETISETKAILGIPDQPFYLDDELVGVLKRGLSDQKRACEEWHSRLKTQDGAFLAQWENGGAVADIASTPYEGGTKVATRKSIAKVFSAIDAAPGLCVGSADLTESTGILFHDAPGNDFAHPSSPQVHYGIREFAMGAILVGLAHHGGIRPMSSTFFVFSDYMRPALRLAALSDASAIFAFTHDSVGVGEDGPTHQPVEQLMSLRAMPNLHVVRPSDANEATELLSDALTSPRLAPTVFALCRQDIPVFDGEEARASLRGARCGGYVLREDPEAVFSLVSTGSEVAVCLVASDRLRERGIATRVVAMPCWRCFDSQNLDYRQSVLRRDIPSVALEAGATLGWNRYVDDAIGIDTFGLSAPGEYVLEYFNMTPESVVAHVLDKLGVAR